MLVYICGRDSEHAGERTGINPASIQSVLHCLSDESLYLPVPRLVFPAWLSNVSELDFALTPAVGEDRVRVRLWLDCPMRNPIYTIAHQQIHIADCLAA